MSRVERHAAEETGIRKEDTNESADKKKKGKPTAFGRLLIFLGSLIMWAAIVLCLVLAAPRLAGIKSYVIVSGSMEPAIPVGSLVYSKEADPKTLEPGDVIVFYSSNAGQGGSTEGVIPVTHRIVENNKAAGEITTKGDANEHNDLSAVIYNNVEGKVIYHIPWLGYLAAPLSSRMGKIAAALIIMAGYLLTEVGAAFRKKQ